MSYDEAFHGITGVVVVWGHGVLRRFWCTRFACSRGSNDCDQLSRNRRVSRPPSTVVHGRICKCHSHYSKEALKKIRSQKPLFDHEPLPSRKLQIFLVLVRGTFNHINFRYMNEATSHPRCQRKEGEGGTQKNHFPCIPLFFPFFVMRAFSPSCMIDVICEDPEAMQLKYKEARKQS